MTNEDLDAIASGDTESIGIIAYATQEVETREAPVTREVTPFERVSLPVVNSAQYDILYTRTPAHAIKSRVGRGGKNFRYVPHGYVTDRLNKAFGFNWDFRLLPVFGGEVYRLTEVEEKGKTVRNVAIYGELTVRVPDPYNHGQWISIVKSGPGSQNWEATVEFGDALKGAKSDGLKVAAHELGIGLDLYYDDDAAITEYETKQERLNALKELERKPEPEPTWASEARELSASNKSISEVKSMLQAKYPDDKSITMPEISKALKGK